MSIHLEQIFSERGQVKTALHSSEDMPQGPLVIMFPGYLGDIDGYNQKYFKIADMVTKTIGPVLRCDNRASDPVCYELQLTENLQAVIEHAIKLLDQGKVLSREIYLFGYSAGGSAVAAVAYKYQQVTKVLLVAPSYDASEELVRTGLNSFTGEVFMAVGDSDRIVSKESVKKMAQYAAASKLFIVSNCDHQFQGTANGRVLSSLFPWAFRDGGKLPDITNGIVLY